MRSPAVSKLPVPELMAHSVAGLLPAFVATEWVQEIASTNTSLLTLAREKSLRAGWPRLLGAHHQTGGKGRLGRAWRDLPGQALMFSAGFALPASQPVSKLQGLGPAIGLSSTLALRPLLSTPGHLCVKWPNDLMFDHGKCAGILIELATRPDATFVVIGMGLNLYGHNNLRTELGREIADIGPNLLPNVTADQLVVDLARTWQQTLADICAHGFSCCQADYAAIDYLANQEVTVFEQGCAIATGMTAGLAADGSLQVKTRDGLEVFHAGDVSVRLKTKVGQP